jgi:uncharacterized membrane protein (DUF485 family)
MLHEPAAQSGPDHASAYKKRLGVWMFIPYALIYASFVLINLVRPIAMEKVVLLGLNLAVVYGFGLILLALVLALIYNHLCARQEKISYSTGARKGGQ